MNDFYLDSEERAIIQYGSSLRNIVTNNLIEEINDAEKQRPQRLIRRTGYQQKESSEISRETFSRFIKANKNTIK